MIASVNRDLIRGEEIMAKDKARLGTIDLYRFIGCLLIMAHHCYHMQG